MTQVIETPLSVTFRLPRNTPTKNRKFNPMQVFLHEHLEDAGVSGRFIYNVTDQAKNRSERRFQLLACTGERGIKLRLRPGDNSSCWEGYLIPENDLEIPTIVLKLQKMIVRRYGGQPKAHPAVPPIAAPVAHVTTPAAPVAAQTRPEPRPAPQPQAAAPVASSELVSLPEISQKIVDRFGWPQPVHVGMGLWCCATEVPPVQALDILDDYNTHNRSPRKRHINIYKGDLDGNIWDLTHQGIAFDVEGELSDGQNRLHACVESDSCRALKTVIFFNLPVGVRGKIDVGANRTVRDAGKLAGQPIAAMEASLVRRSLAGFDYNLRKTEISHTAIMQYRDKHAQAVTWVKERFAGLRSRITGVTTAPVYAALFGAYYHEDLDRLAEFAKVLITGIAPTPEEYSAIALRDLLLGTRGRSTPNPTESYRKVERVIKAFCDRQKYDTIYPAGKELYPVPEDPTTFLRRRALRIPSQTSSADTSALTESV